MWSRNWAAISSQRSASTIYERPSVLGFDGALVCVIVLPLPGREPDPTAVFCGIEDCAGGCNVGEAETSE